MALERFAVFVTGVAASLTSLLKIGQAAARVDDYLLAELLKLAPFDGTNTARVVLPYQENGAASPTNLPLLSIAAGGGTTIQVRPFRAIIGTRVTPAGLPATAVPPAEFLLPTAAEQSYRDIRSAVLAQNLGADGRVGFTIPSTQFVSNSSGHPRIDLIYATLYLEQASSSATLLVKPPTSGSAAPTSIAPTKLTSVGSPAGAANAIGVVVGTPALVPTLPATPADTANQYVFPLGYVIVPDGFVSGSTALLAHNICTVAQAGAIAAAMGGGRIRPLANLAGANGLVNLASNWRTAFTRPGWTVPTTMVGGEIAWCLFDATLSSVSAPFGDAAILDATIDWRNRYFVAVVYASQSSGQIFGSDPQSGSAPFVPCGGLSGSGANILLASGQSFRDDSLSTLASSRNGGVVWWASPVTLSALAGGSALGMYVDLATGALKAFYTGTPARRLFVWIFATAPYDNA
ncbi:MAG TPA: hypothetical protein VGI39_03160 [Polyangiaceae bacterium]|jgi:hypothetical protein